MKCFLKSLRYTVNLNEELEMGIEELVFSDNR